MHVCCLSQGKGKFGDPSLPMFNLIRKEKNSLFLSIYLPLQSCSEYLLVFGQCFENMKSFISVIDYLDPFKTSVTPEKKMALFDLSSEKVCCRKKICWWKETGTVWSYFLS